MSPGVIVSIGIIQASITSPLPQGLDAQTA
jgi:hypothetical protein